MSEEETIAYAADLQVLLDKGLTLVGAVAYLDARKSPLVFDPVPDVAAVNALPELLERVKRYEDALDEIEAQQQYLRVGGAYVDDTGQLEAGLERAVEIARAALKDTP